MQILFSLLSITFISISISAQVEKGQSILGGQVSFDYSTHELKPSVDSPVLTNKLVGVGFSPSFGYMISKHWALGGNLSYGYSKNHRENYNHANGELTNYADISQNMGVGLFAERYFKLRDALYFRAQGGISFEYFELKREEDGLAKASKNIGRTLRTYVSPSLSYFLNESIALKLNWEALTYSYHTRDNQQSISSQLELNFNISHISYGLEWYF